MDKLKYIVIDVIDATENNSTECQNVTLYMQNFTLPTKYKDCRVYKEIQACMISSFHPHINANDQQIQSNLIRNRPITSAIKATKLKDNLKNSLVQKENLEKECLRLN